MALALEDFYKVDTRNPKGWVKAFITSLVEDEITVLPYQPKTAKQMITQAAQNMGVAVRVLEDKGKFYACKLKPVKPVAKAASKAVEKPAADATPAKVVEPPKPHDAE